MSTDMINGLSDQELHQMIAAAQGLIQARSEKRKNDAMEQIRQIAANAQITVSFDAGGRARTSKPVLKAGDRYLNPADSNQSHVVGKGKPPNWFVALRDKNKLPAPAAPDAQLREL